MAKDSLSDEVFVTRKELDELKTRLIVAIVTVLVGGAAAIASSIWTVHSDMATKEDVNNLRADIVEIRRDVFELARRKLALDQQSLEVEKQHVAVLQDDVKAHRDLAAAIRSVNLAQTLWGDATINACPQSFQEARSALFMHHLKASQ